MFEFGQAGAFEEKIADYRYKIPQRIDVGEVIQDFRHILERQEQSAHEDAEHEDKPCRKQCLLLGGRDR